MKDLNQIVADNIKFARTHFGTMQRELTQQELGKLAGISSMHIAHFESGRRLPSIPNLLKLCKALQVTTDWLLFFSIP